MWIWKSFAASIICYLDPPSNGPWSPMNFSIGSPSLDNHGCQRLSNSHLKSVDLPVQWSGIRKNGKALCFPCFSRRRRVAQSWMMSCVTCVFACFVASFCCLWRVNGVVWRSSKGAPPLPREPICGSWADDLGLAPPALTTPNTQSSNCEIHFLKFKYKSQI